MPMIVGSWTVDEIEQSKGVFQGGVCEVQLFQGEFLRPGFIRGISEAGFYKGRFLRPGFRMYSDAYHCRF